MTATRRSRLAAAGGVGTAFLGALCCIGPLIFVTFGIGAGLATAFEPLRPIFGIAALCFFGIAAYTVYGTPHTSDHLTDDSAPGQTCAVPRSRRRDKLILWVALIIALILWTFPTWSVWLV